VACPTRRSQSTTGLGTNASGWQEGRYASSSPTPRDFSGASFAQPGETSPAVRCPAIARAYKGMSPALVG
jgi:hypothetical protein